jgi:hypothetical protein
MPSSSSSSSSAVSLERRIELLEKQACCLQTNIPAEQRTEAVARVASAMGSAPALLGCALVRVPSDYYARPLAARAGLLGCGPSSLCKTIVLENLAPGATVVDDLSAPLYRQRYVAVVLQYVTKLKMDAVARFLVASSSSSSSSSSSAASSVGPPPEETAANTRAPPPPPPPLSAAKVAMAPKEAADALTGFPFNAVTPFGAKKAIPLILSKHVAKMPFIWLGGGEVDVKLRVFVKTLLQPDACAPALAGGFGGAGAGAGAGAGSDAWLRKANALYVPAVLDCVEPREGEGDDDE